MGLIKEELANSMQREEHLSEIMKYTSRISTL
jgi:hypothetical protein